MDSEGLLGCRHLELTSLWPFSQTEIQVFCVCQEVGIVSTVCPKARLSARPTQLPTYQPTSLPPPSQLTEVMQ